MATKKKTRNKKDSSEETNATQYTHAIAHTHFDVKFFYKVKKYNSVLKLTLYAQFFRRKKNKPKLKKSFTSTRKTNQQRKNEVNNGMIKNLKPDLINGSLLNLCSRQNSLVDSLARQNYK